MKAVTIIGISGISGAGKTTLVKALATHLKASSLYWDDFDEISTQPEDYVAWFERGGEYSEFDYSVLAETLSELKRGIQTIHPVTKEIIHPRSIIIVDAPLGKAHRQTAQYIDKVIHLDVPLDVALARRLIHDLQETTLDKKTLITNLQYYLDKSRKLFSEESMCKISNSADLVINGTDTITNQIKDIISFVKTETLTIPANIAISIVDKLDAETEEKMDQGYAEYESKNGINVNYKRFSMIMSDADHNIMGVLNAYTAFAEIYVDDLWIDKRFRGNGYGKILLKELENKFRGKGFNNINLVTSAFQAPEFYKKCGFKEEFKRYNEKNPQLTKSFFVKYFSEEIQNQGIDN